MLRQQVFPRMEPCKREEAHHGHLHSLVVIRYQGLGWFIDNIPDPLLFGLTMWFGQHTAVKKHVWRSLHALQQGREAGEWKHPAHNGWAGSPSQYVAVPGTGREKCCHNILHRKKGHKALWGYVGTHVTYMYMSSVCPEERQGGYPLQTLHGG